MTHPVRIQSRRTKGFNLQAESRAINGLPAVSCVRGTTLGNPFKIGDPHPDHGHPITRTDAIALFIQWYEQAEHLIETGRMGEADFNAIKAVGYAGALRKHNGACWCAPHQECHVDYLLKRARS